MKAIQVYDPPMCCATGVCGPEVDPDLVNFASMLSQLANQGVSIERFGLSRQPMAFAKNAAVKELLNKEGSDALPIIFWDGEVKMKGRYPTTEERPEWLRAALGEQGTAS